MSTCKRMWTDREIRSMAVDTVENKTNLKVFENIVDKDGHERFIEGEGTPIEREGVNSSYCKWSLSGSHLMLVLCLDIEVDGEIPANATIGTYDLPSWMVDKIIPVFASNFIDVKSMIFRDSSWAQQNMSVGLSKGNDGKIKLINVGAAVTITSTKKYGRVQFDLLIDDE